MTGDSEIVVIAAPKEQSELGGIARENGLKTWPMIVSKTATVVLAYTASGQLLLAEVLSRAQCKWISLWLAFA